MYQGDCGERLARVLVGLKPDTRVWRVQTELDQYRKGRRRLFDLDWDREYNREWTADSAGY